MNAKTMHTRTLRMLSLTVFLLMLVGMSAQAARPIAVATDFRGTVEFQHDNKWQEFHKNLPFYDGDKIRTGEDGYCALMFVDDKSQIRLNPNTEATLGHTVNADSSWNKRVDMELGRVLAQVTEQKGALQVATPTAVASVKGTEFWVMMNPDGTVTQLTLEGVVELMSVLTGETKDVSAGYQGDVDGNGNIDVTVLNEDIVPDYLDTMDVEKIEIKFIDEDGNEKTLIIPVKIEK
ncbi:FecR family protein [bacterium]|nr:FecR family protein [bacterium]